MNERLDPRLEIGVALLMIVISATALFGTMDIPPGKFEPLGSAPVPQAVAGLIIILALGLIVRACIDQRPLAASSADRYLDATAVVVLTLLFVAAMNYRLATFADPDLDLPDRDGRFSDPLQAALAAGGDRRRADHRLRLPIRLHPHLRRRPAGALS